MQRALHLPAALLFSTSLLAQSSPVHHWPLDEFGGTEAQDIVSASNGSLVNGPQWVPGNFGSALSFDGADDRVELGPCDLTTGTGDAITLSLWLKAGLMAGNEQVLLAKTEGPAVDDHVWSVSQINSTALLFRLQAGGSVTELATTGSSLFGGAWYHVAAVYDGAEMRLYLNGALMATAPKSGALPWVPQAPASMGDRLDGNASFLGVLDDVRIYDHALTEPEIFDLVIGDVATSVEEVNGITVSEEGRIGLPNGNWEWMELRDASGRIVEERNAKEGGMLTLRDRPAGLYLVCLWGWQGAMVRPFVMP